MKTFLDFFSGIGGFRLGLERAGMKCVGYCENDKHAVRSYKAMYETKEDWCSDDIRKVKPGEIPRADIWCAGTPCQNVSVAGRHAGLSGERSGLFFDLIKLLKSQEEEDKPEWVLLENVKGLLSSNRGWDYLEYLSCLEESGYDVEWQVINSRDFGVPQYRERVFTLGHLRTKGGRKVLPVKGTSHGDIKRVKDGAQAERIYDPGGISSTLIGEAGGDGGKTGLYLIDQVYKGAKVTTEARCLMAKYNAGIINHTSSNSGVLEIHGARPCVGLNFTAKDMNGRRIKDADDPMFTLTAIDRHGVVLDEYADDKAVFWEGKYVRIRRLTPRECFRLQGFPDELFEKAQEVNSDTQLYRQAGNGVTVPVVTAIGLAIIKA